MRKLFTITAAVLITLSVFAQAPQKMSYQAVIRNTNDQLVTGQQIGLRISILQNSIDGNMVYQETYNPNPETNINGLLTIEIGQGVPLTGVFAEIDWAAGPYFIKTETDLTGGTNYTITSTSQLLSVPYALHAETVGNITETDPVFESSPVASIEDTDINNWDDAYSWGDHLDAGYLTDFTITEEDVTAHQGALQIAEEQITDLQDYLLEEIDPLFTAWDKSTGIVITEEQISDLQDYLTEETDPTVPQHVKDIEAGNISNWEEAHSWGDHTAEGYLTEESQNLSDVLLEGNNAGGNQIKNIAEPTDEKDATTKAYVDSLFTELLLKIEELEQNIEHNFVCGTSTVTFNYNGSSVTYGTVVGANNACWLDRNLGASRVAISSTDEEAYGDLFQWGRADDGHQLRTSETTSTLSNSDTPGHGEFIISTISPHDWRNPQNDDLWQGESGTNNPCPVGYRLPTEAELDAEVQSWSSNDAEGAFASPLKLPLSGFRLASNGSITSVDSGASYWSSSLDDTNSRRLGFSITFASMSGGIRGLGLSVRCIKDSEP